MKSRAPTRKLLGSTSRICWYQLVNPYIGYIVMFKYVRWSPIASLQPSIRGLLVWSLRSSNHYQLLLMKKLLMKKLWNRLKKRTCPKRLNSLNFWSWCPRKSFTLISPHKWNTSTTINQIMSNSFLRRRTTSNTTTNIFTNY